MKLQKCIKPGASTIFKNFNNWLRYFSFLCLAVRIFLLIHGLFEQKLKFFYFIFFGFPVHFPHLESKQYKGFGRVKTRRVYFRERVSTRLIFPLNVKYFDNVVLW